MSEPWFHFECYVKVGEGPGEATPDILASLMDTLAEFVLSAGEDMDFEAHIGGVVQGPSPTWAKGGDDH